MPLIFLCSAPVSRCHVTGDMMMPAPKVYLPGNDIIL